MHGLMHSYIRFKRGVLSVCFEAAGLWAWQVLPSQGIDLYLRLTEPLDVGTSASVDAPLPSLADDELDSIDAPGGGVIATSCPRFGAPVADGELESIDAPGGRVVAITLPALGALV